MDAHPHVYTRGGRNDFDLKMERGKWKRISYSLVFLIETRFLIGEDCRELGDSMYVCVNQI